MLTELMIGVHLLPGWNSAGMLTVHHLVIMNVLNTRGSPYSSLGCVLAEFGDILVVCSRMDRNFVLMVAQTWVLDVTMMILAAQGLMTRLVKDPLGLQEQKINYHQGGKISTISFFSFASFQVQPW